MLNHHHARCNQAWQGRRGARPQDAGVSQRGLPMPDDKKTPNDLDHRLATGPILFESEQVNGGWVGR